MLAAEGSDWCWWYGPEHSSANDPEFDILYRKHLTEIYNALGEPAPDALAHPIKRAPERGRSEAPTAYLDVKVDGRESSYFEWLGAGSYATDHRSSTMHGRQYVLGNVYYGFGPSNFWLRVDPIPEAIAQMADFQIAHHHLGLARDAHHPARRKSAPCCRLHRRTERLMSAASRDVMSAAYEEILELSLARELFDLRGRRELLVSVALWKGGLPVDVLPAEGVLQVLLGEENFAWPPS